MSRVGAKATLTMGNQTAQHTPTEQGSGASNQGLGVQWLVQVAEPRRQIRQFSRPLCHGASTRVRDICTIKSTR